MATLGRFQQGWLTPVAAAAMLAACGGGGSDLDTSSEPGPAPLTVPKVASCATGGVPETALQGQVPAAMRASGFKGFNCNLSLVGQYPGEGGNWSAATFTDGASRTCAYHATAVPNATRQTPGVPVIDMTDGAHPIQTAALTTASMLDPWESLRVNSRRQILIADNGQNGGGGPEVDIYDLSADCRTPQLMSSLAVGTGADGGTVAPGKPTGHEGNVSVDGLTYYIGDTTNGTYNAVDISNTTKPKVIASFDVRTIGSGAHGLSISSDGNRMYGVAGSLPTPAQVADPNFSVNGFIILDTSEVQQRKPGAQIKLVSRVTYRDGSTAQHTLPIKVAGKQYLVMVDEAGSAGSFFNPTSFHVQLACDNKLAPFGMARIYDISDEKKPVLASKLMLETNDTKNCGAVLPDVADLAIFTYDSHYCSVDNRENATVLACSYFNSGIRVFDIRDPTRPKEIAYYNPPSSTAKAGSSHAVFGQWREGGPDWCSSRLDFDFAKKQLTTMCQDNGLLVMKFAEGTWPFSESTPTKDHD